MIFVCALIIALGLAWVCITVRIGLAASDALDSGLLGIIAYFACIILGNAIPIQVIYWLVIYFKLN